MKEMTIMLAVSGLLALTAFGQADLVKQRAKELVNQNNVRQGIATPSGATQMPAPQDPAQAAQLRATQQIIGRIQADLAAIQSSGQATAAQRQQLSNDLLLAARGAVKPSQAGIDKLAADLSAALPGRSLSAAEQTRLARNLNAIVNSAAIPSGQKQGVFDDIQAILQVVGLNRANATGIVGDLKAIASEVAAR